MGSHVSTGCHCVGCSKAVAVKPETLTELFRHTFEQYAPNFMNASITWHQPRRSSYMYDGSGDVVSLAEYGDFCLFPNEEKVYNLAKNAAETVEKLFHNGGSNYVLMVAIPDSTETVPVWRGVNIYHDKNWQLSDGTPSAYDPLGGSPKDTPPLFSYRFHLATFSVVASAVVIG